MLELLVIKLQIVTNILGRRISTAIQVSTNNPDI